MKRTIGKFVIAMIVAAIFAVSNNEPFNRHLTQSSTDRPVMHTFFYSLEEAEENVLNLWKKEWTNAGFDAKVLTVEDAKRHPDFEMVKNIMEPIHGENGYNALCFYRWLAMAASGGGWMSDHDTFPTNFPLHEAIDLPNGGKFTTFQGHIPAMMSGSAKEWDKLIKLLIEVKETKSDMFAFQMVLVRHPDSAIADRGSSVRHGFAYNSPHKVDCKRMAKGRAIHVSHSSTKQAVSSGLYPLEGRINEKNPFGFHTRAEAAEAFLREWRDQCDGSMRVSTSENLDVNKDEFFMKTIK